MSDWTAKRFWKEASVEAVDGGFAIYLDGRPVKTPAKALLKAPTRAMANAIAAEWDAQVDKINPETMPVTRGANAAIDKVSVSHAEVVDMLAEYGDSDLLCYRATAPEELVARQNEIWDPLLEWAAAELNAPMTSAPGVMHVPQSPETLATLRAELVICDNFELAALHDLISLSGSLILGLAVSKGHLEAQNAWEISRLDEVWQIEQWGEDDEAAALVETKRQAFHAASTFFLMNSDRS